MPRCFVLGAGFSRACELPLARELTRLVFEKAYGWVDQGDFGRETRDAYRKFLGHLYPSLDFESHWPDFEDLITVLDEWTQWQKHYEGRDRSGEAPSAGHLKGVLLKSVEELICYRASEAHAETASLIERFVRQRADKGDWIISFNWDTLIEIACKKQNIQVHYKASNDPGLHVAKPHGSLNLAETTRDDYDVARHSINVYSLDFEWEDPRRVVLRAQNPADSMLRIVAPFEKTTLIEPSARKVYLSPWINIQWARAYQMMCAASDIVVIGFSLPAADYRPRVLFQVATLQRDPLPKIHIVDPVADQRVDHFKTVVGVEIEPIVKPWSEWFDENGE